MRTFGFALLASLSVACSSSSPVTPTSARATAVTPDSIDAVIVELADKGGKTLVAYLVSRDTGDQTGTLKMSVNAGQTELCYSLRYTGSIAKPTAIVIYRGDTSVNATTVQAFTFTASGPLYACTTTSVSREFLHDIGRNAADFGVGVAVAASVVLRGRFESLKQPYH